MRADGGSLEWIGQGRGLGAVVFWRPMSRRRRKGGLKVTMETEMRAGYIVGRTPTSCPRPPFHMSYVMSPPAPAPRHPAPGRPATRWVLYGPRFRGQGPKSGPPGQGLGPGA